MTTQSFVGEHGEWTVIRVQTMVLTLFMDAWRAMTSTSLQHRCFNIKLARLFTRATVADPNRKIRIIAILSTQNTIRNWHTWHCHRPKMKIRMLAILSIISEYNKEYYNWHTWHCHEPKNYINSKHTKYNNEYYIWHT